MMLNAEWQMEHEIACCENGELKGKEQTPNPKVGDSIPSDVASETRVAAFPQGKKDTRIICGEFEPSVKSGALVRDLQMKKCIKKENQTPKEQVRE